MWGALIATSLASWLHHLTAIPDPHPDAAHRPAPLLGLGIRDGKAMIATLRHRLIRIPGRVIHHALGEVSSMKFSVASESWSQS